MKTLWNILSFLAVVHILALAILIVWLWQTQRLSKERLQTVREAFAMSIPEAQASAARQAADADVQRQKKIEEEKKANPPIDSAAQIQSFALLKQQEEQSKRRLEDDKRALAQELESVTTSLNKRQAALDLQRQAWESQTRADQQRKGDQQFLQTVRQYEQAAPKQAKKMLMELVNEKKTDQAVAYLDAMNPRAASKILKEFKTDSEITLATELLEKLRTFGAPASQASAAGTSAANPGEAKDAKDTGNATGPANSDQPRGRTPQAGGSASAPGAAQPRSAG